MSIGEPKNFVQNCVYYPWQPTYPAYPTYQYAPETRWKCPDCKGWVKDSVQVHYCATPITTSTKPYVVPNTIHYTNTNETTDATLLKADSGG